MLVVEIGTAHEVVASGTAQLALFVDQFMATLQTISPMFSLALNWLGNRTFIAALIVQFHHDKNLSFAGNVVEEKYL